MTISHRSSFVLNGFDCIPYTFKLHLLQETHIDKCPVSKTNLQILTISFIFQTLRPRIKRVNLRDLLFLMEQDKTLNQTDTLYRTFLK